MVVALLLALSAARAASSIHVRAARGGPADPRGALLEPALGRRQGRALPPARRGPQARDRADRAEAGRRPQRARAAPRSPRRRRPGDGRRRRVAGDRRHARRTRGPAVRVHPGGHAQPLRARPRRRPRRRRRRARRVRRRRGAPRRPRRGQRPGVRQQRLARALRRGGAGGGLPRREAAHDLRLDPRRRSGPAATSRRCASTAPDGTEQASGAAILVSNNAYRLRLVSSAPGPASTRALLGVTVFGVGQRRRARDRVDRTPSSRCAPIARIPAGIDGEAVVLDAPLRFVSRPARAARARIAPQHPGASPSAALPDSPWKALRALARIGFGSITRFGGPAGVRTARVDSPR